LEPEKKNEIRFSKTNFLEYEINSEISFPKHISYHRNELSKLLFWEQAFQKYGICFGTIFLGKKTSRTRFPKHK